MTLNQMSTTTANRPLSFFLHYQNDSMLDLDSPYQRGDVWGLTRRRNMIFSFISGVPIPAVVVNDRYAAQFHEDGYSEERNNSFMVVDGKQRVTTLLMYAADRFGVPADWFDDGEVDHADSEGMVWWSGLTPKGRSRIKSSTIGVCEGRLKTLQEEADLFDLINFGGLAQGETDDEPFGWED